MKVKTAIFIFFFAGALFIVSNEGLALSNFDAFEQFGRLYLSWLAHIGENIKTITGQVISSVWVP